MNFDITNLKISLTSFDESNSSIDEIIERIENDVRNNKEAIRLKTEQREQILKDNEALNAEIVSLNEKIEQIKIEYSKSK